MKRIFKRLIAVLCICTILFSISGCVSTANTNDAKSLSANSSYNIDEYDEESVKIDIDTGMAFSEKGSVRFEDHIELVDFWEYGKNKSNTIYFKGLKSEMFENYDFQTFIDFAFEYKNMIYFLKQSYDKEKTNFNLELYRTDLVGDDITKISTIKSNVNGSHWEVVDFAIKNVYVQNNTLIFNVGYYTYDSSYDSEINKIYKIDLKTGIFESILNGNDVQLAAVKCDSDFTYLYLNYFSYNDDGEIVKPRVYRINNDTKERSILKYDFGNSNYSYIYAVYNDILICESAYNNVFLARINQKPKTIISNTGNREINYICLTDNNVLVKYDNSKLYSFNLDTEKLNFTNIGPKKDINHVIYKLGDKYLCFLDNNYDYTYYSVNDVLRGSYGFECYYLSSVLDVETDKHNFEEIKNQCIVDDISLYPYWVWQDYDDIES